MLVSNHVKRAFFSNMKLELFIKDEEMEKEYTHMITSPKYRKKTPENSSWMFLDFF